MIPIRLGGGLKRILVTGASGFIGRPLVSALVAAGHNVRVAVRRSISFSANVEILQIPDLTAPIDWPPLLAECETVIHAAGLAHVRSSELHDSVNHLATARLATEAAAAGIAHFVYISSIGAQSGPAADHVLTERDPPRPTDSYGRSKLAAEMAIHGAGVPYTVFRPVLTYGAGVKGNMGALLRLAASPWPLPFGAFVNRRSLLAVWNLISAIQFAIETPAALGETYVICDPNPLTLAEIIETLRAAMGRPPGLVSVSPKLIEWALKSIGYSRLYERIGGTLVIDPAKLIAAGWRPVVETREGLVAMVKGRRLDLVERKPGQFDKSNSSSTSPAVRSPATRGPRS